MALGDEVVGIGELVYDHIFVENNSRVLYHGSRGGGSIFNMLVNSAFRGTKSIAVGVGGGDWFGEAAISELDALGVNISNMRLIQGKSTRVIFQTLRHASHNDNESLHTFSTVCPVCNVRQNDRSLAQLTARDLDRVTAAENAGFVCFDKLTRERLRLARHCNQIGIRTSLDLGRIGYLRYLPATQVLAALYAFDVVLAPSQVVMSLMRRAGYLSQEDLAEVGPRLLLYVSHGRKGMDICDTRKSFETVTERLDAARCSHVIDDSGAGDAFLAGIICHLIEVMRKGVQLDSYAYSALRDVTQCCLNDVPKVLAMVGARGHISLPARAQQSVTHVWEGMSVEDIRLAIDWDKPCPFCGTRKDEPRPKERSSPAHRRVGAKGNLTRLLPKRMFFSAENRQAVNECKEVLRLPGTAIVVGTGGSYAAADFTAMVLNGHGQSFAHVLRPLDYIKTVSKPSDIVVVTTYSGSTADCGDVIDRAKELNVHRIILVTAAPQPKLAGKLREGKDQVISYGRPLTSQRSARERGFVSIAGTVAPCTLWTAAVVETDITRLAQQLEALSLISWLVQRQPGQSEAVLNESLQALVNAVRVGTTIPVLGGGLAWPAMVDLESKFVEGGLGIIQFHEVKDFSHGRFIKILDNEGQNPTPAVYFRVGTWNRYEQLLLKTLERDRPVLHFATDEVGVLGALELLVRIQYLAQWLGEALGIDISRPLSIPAAGLDLYRWHGGLSR